MFGFDGIPNGGNNGMGGMFGGPPRGVGGGRAIPLELLLGMLGAGGRPPSCFTGEILDDCENAIKVNDRREQLNHMQSGKHLGFLTTFCEKKVTKLEKKLEHNRKVVAAKGELPAFFMVEGKKGKMKLVETAPVVDKLENKIPGYEEKLECINGYKDDFNSVVQKASTLAETILELNTAHNSMDISSSEGESEDEVEERSISDRVTTLREGDLADFKDEVDALRDRINVDDVTEDKAKIMSQIEDSVVEMETYYNLFDSCLKGIAARDE